ncbi:hypothetical protein PV08_10114 [Exophiala spinifera]|uniref:DUF7702 domain-containing protein n=1 Tax=Exophiala spinifera TaxID=91928 RepID=A0A0D2AWE1_9EURO|nr:uncharacterized protein PV08_10114 [Exophiala spinifera]KIW10815.1 hypothetical protein PV08_10114 [Exophiala spinifera]
MAVDALSTAKLVVYSIFVQFAVFCFFKHRRLGLLGWWYVNLFCVLRIVTGAIGVHGDKNGETVTILNSIGISPLLLALSGLVHEVKRATNKRSQSKFDPIFELLFHGIVLAGMALIIVAIINLEDNDNISSSKTKLDVGSAISCVAYGLLVAWTVSLLVQSRQPPQNVDAIVVRYRNVLLFACFLSLPLLAIRIGWGVAYLQLKINHPGSGFLTSLAITVCLSVVPEMLIIAVVLAAGVFTHKLHDTMTAGTPWTTSRKGRA